MLFYITVFISIFLIVFILCVFCLIYKKLILENIYKIIPAICIGLWALYFLTQRNYSLTNSDYISFYISGQLVLTNPEALYGPNSGFFYLPSFAILFCFTFSLLPYEVGYYLFFILNYILGILSIREFDKILILKGIGKKRYRFLFLFIISNGYYVYYQFRWNQSKYLLFFILLLIVRREIQFKKEKKELNFYIYNYNLFLFAIAIAPYFIFLLLIYAFQDIPFKEYLTRVNIKKYIILISSFVIQNFIFFIYPATILTFLDGINSPSRRHKKLKMIYLKDWFEVSSSNMYFITFLFTAILTIITLYLIKNEKLQIEEKFGYFSLSYLFFGVFSYQISLSLILFSFVLLLFVPHLKQSEAIQLFIMDNKFLFIGLCSIIFMSFLSYELLDYDFNSIINKDSLDYFNLILSPILFTLMNISLISLKLERYRNEKKF